MAMDRLSSLLPRVLKQRGLHEVAVASGAVLAAQRWIDAEFGMHAQALKARKFHGGTLFIDAADAIALAECSRRIPDLLAALGRQLPDCRVDAIRCLRGTAAR